MNCGAIPEGTIDSELFGHEKGSFTGAIEARKGYFEEADGGTLFLDEVGELPLSSQAKLLRVLQSGEYIRVGSSKVSKTDVRVIAATNVNLMYAVSQGKFRADLYYRLNAIQITMPALRDRKEDIYLLFRKFTSDFSEKYGMSKITLTHDAIELLTKYRWPGNIRQLQNVANTVSALEGQRLTPGLTRCEVDAGTLASYLPKDEAESMPVQYKREGSTINDDEKQEIYKALYALNSEVNKLKAIVASGNFRQAAEPEHDDRKTLAPPAYDMGGSYVSKPEPDWAADNQDVDIQDHREEVKEAEKLDNCSIEQAYQDMIHKALEKYNGNRKKAAKELGISERTLYRKISRDGKDAKAGE
ncbi:putative uncharacterized protein [Bacteroides sp. CAG:770]|nr:putative uncharacterized protein [Bacteroides sp. CAG:770]